MAEFTLTLDSIDLMLAKIAQAKGIAHLAGQVKAGDIIGCTLTDSMWAITDMLDEVAAEIEKSMPRARDVQEGGVQ